MEEKVVSVAVGSQHVLALAESGNLYGWGNNSHGEVEGSAEAIPVPLLLPAGSNQGVMYIECGPHEVSMLLLGYMWYKHNSRYF